MRFSIITNSEGNSRLSTTPWREKSLLLSIYGLAFKSLRELFTTSKIFIGKINQAVKGEVAISHDAVSKRHVRSMRLFGQIISTVWRLREIGNAFPGIRQAEGTWVRFRQRFSWMFQVYADCNGCFKIMRIAYVLGQLQAAAGKIWLHSVFVRYARYLTICVPARRPPRSAKHTPMELGVLNHPTQLHNR